MNTLLTLLRAAACLLALFGAVSCASRTPPPPTVATVDIQRYAGKWYEIAHKPMIFQRGCRATTAEYSLNADGSIRVVNSCLKEDGRRETAVGRAVPVPGSGNAKLKVSFFGPFTGDYWVMALDEKRYAWAVIGHPQRKYLWILSRTPRMDPALYARLTGWARAQGYDLSDLIVTDQSANLRR